MAGSTSSAAASALGHFYQEHAALRWSLSPKLVPEDWKRDGEGAIE